MEGWQSALSSALTVTPGIAGWAVVLIGVGLAILIGLRFYNWRLKRSFQAEADIRSIRVLPDADELELEYVFRHRGHEYSGKGRLSPAQLLDARGAAPVLRYNAEIDLPVLYWNEQTYVGNEAIEHALLAKRPVLRIRFLSADPSRNFPVPSILPVAVEERRDRQL